MAAKLERDPTAFFSEQASCPVCKNEVSPQKTKKKTVCKKCGHVFGEKDSGLTCQQCGRIEALTIPKIIFIGFVAVAMWVLAIVPQVYKGWPSWGELFGDVIVLIFALVSSGMFYAALKEVSKARRVARAAPGR